MLSVRAPADDVLPEMEQMDCDQLAIASYNGPKLCVVAGPDEVIEQLRQRLDAKDIVCKELHTSHAFHSPMMDDIVEPFREFVSNIELRAPDKPVMSTVTAAWMTPELATDPDYWARHMRAPVAFSQAIEQLWADDPSRVLIELGPRRTLATLARQQATDKKTQRTIASLTDNAEDNAEWFAILGAVGQLWMLGQEINWQAFHQAALCQSSRPSKITLPTYQFQRERHFVEPKVVTPDSPSAAEPTCANTPQASATPSPCGAVATPTIQPPVTNTVQPTTPIITREKKVTVTRQDQIREAVEEILENTSGIELADFEPSMTFFEMGMDSLVLTQTAAAIKRELGVNVSFRQLLEGLPTIPSLVEFLDGEVAADKFVDVVEEVEVAAPAPSEPVATAPAATPPVATAPVTTAAVPAVAPVVSAATPAVAASNWRISCPANRACRHRQCGSSNHSKPIAGHAATIAITGCIRQLHRGDTAGKSGSGSV